MCGVLVSSTRRGFHLLICVTVLLVWRNDPLFWFSERVIDTKLRAIFVRPGIVSSTNWKRVCPKRKEGALRAPRLRCPV